MDIGRSDLNEAWLITGGNVGDRLYYLSEARKRIEHRCGSILKASAIFETAAWGLTGQPAFYNQGLVLQTSLSARNLLDELLDVEASLDRVRKERYGPRTIDIDILFLMKKRSMNRVCMYRIRSWPIAGLYWNACMTLIRTKNTPGPITRLRNCCQPALTL